MPFVQKNREMAHRNYDCVAGGRRQIIRIIFSILNGLRVSRDLCNRVSPYAHNLFDWLKLTPALGISQSDISICSQAKGEPCKGRMLKYCKNRN